MRIFLLFAVFAAIVHAEEAAVPKARPEPVPGRYLWFASMATLAAANALDIHSSWGKRELNPALAGPNRKFGREGALIKLGMQGGLMAIEYLIARRRPSQKIYRALTFINFGAAAAVGGVAARNYTVPR